MTSEETLGRVFAIIVLVLLWGTLATGLAADDAYSQFKVGITQEHELEVFKARETFQQVVGVDPTNTGYREHFAWFLHRNGFAEEAVMQFRALLVSSPGNNAYLRGLGWNEWQVGRHDAALAAYRQLFNLPVAGADQRPAFTKIRELLGQENREAVRRLQDELTAHPADRALRVKLVQAYLDAGMFPEARKLAEGLLQEPPADLSMQLSLVQALSWGGQHQEAAENMKQLVATHPDNAFMQLKLGRLLIAAGKRAEAAPHLNRAVALNGRSAEAHKELAEHLAITGNAAEAMALANKIADTPEDALTSKLARARVRHFSGSLHEAQPIYRQILATYPQNREALWGLTETLVYTGAHAAAAEVMTQWELGAAADERFALQKHRLNAATAPLLGIRTNYYGNSADFLRMDAGVDGRLHLTNNFTLLPAYVFSRFSQQGFSDIQRHAVSLNAEYRPGKSFSAGAGLGLSHLDSGQQRLSSNVALTLALGPGGEVGIAHDHRAIIDTEPSFGNPIYNYVVTLGALGRRIYTDDYTLSLKQELGERFVAWGKLTHGDYADGNRKGSRTLGVDFLPLRTTGPTISYTYFYLDYARPAPAYSEGDAVISAYFDPIDLEVHTIGISTSRSMTESMRLGGEWRASYIPKSSGIANSLFGHISLRIAQTQTIRLDARLFHQDKGVTRTGIGGHFSAFNVLLAYEYTFQEP